MVFGVGVNMLNTLYKKLTVTLFSLIFIIGSIFFFLVLYATNMYQQEVNQKLNQNLAKQIAAEYLLIDDQKLNRNGITDLFQNLMVVNRSIEVYLLNNKGDIIAHAAPKNLVKLDSVDLTSLQSFFDGKQAFPIVGDDPRHPGQRKVFSAAQIVTNGLVSGYLYIVLGGDQFTNIASTIKESYVLKLSSVGLFACMLTALFAGLFLFYVSTGRLRLLAQIMDNHTNNESDNRRQQHRYYLDQDPKDEIDRLGQRFNMMADRIEGQLLKLKEKDAKRRDLLANISHDLRNPTTTLLGYLETLNSPGDRLTSGEKKTFLEIAIRQTEKLGDLVSQLFDLAKLESLTILPNKERFSSGELLQDVVSGYKLRTEKKKVNIIIDYGENIPDTYGDIRLFDRVLQNLIDNALHSMPVNGCIQLSLSTEKEFIIVTITDTGCGIPQNDVPDLFERFYQGQNNDHGRTFNSGLGLAIVKQILDLHNCKIMLNSAVNSGTSVCFQIPIFRLLVN